MKKNQKLFLDSLYKRKKRNCLVYNCGTGHVLMLGRKIASYLASIINILYFKQNRELEIIDLPLNISHGFVFYKTKYLLPNFSFLIICTRNVHYHLSK